jgi:hypothetical protein
MALRPAKAGSRGQSDPAKYDINIVFKRQGPIAERTVTIVVFVFKGS